jgi:lysophospholipase L1-like esterase
MGIEFDPSGESRRLFDHIPWRRYVAMGDSVVEGSLGDPYPPYPEVGWTQMIADALAAIQPDLKFFNLGKRYLTTREIRETQLELALALEPDLALVWAGGNDLMREHFDSRITEAELESIVTPLEESGATVLTGTLFNMLGAGILSQEVVDLFRDKFDALNEAVRRVGQRHNNVVFIDFAEMSWTADPDLYSSDLQHVNRRGYAASAETAIRCLADIAGKATVGKRHVE